MFFFNLIYDDQSKVTSVKSDLVRYIFMYNTCMSNGTDELNKS